jgi:chromosome segregation ATPase
MTSHVRPSRLPLPLGAAAALTLAFVLAAPTAAQQMMPPQQEIPDSVQQLMEEFQETEARFSALQSQVIQGNAELQSRQQEIGIMVNDAVREIDPQAEARIQRLQALEQEAIAAQEDEDMAGFQALLMEAQELQTALQAAQEEALEREDVQDAIEAFQAEVLSAMTEMDPEAETMLERLQDLAERIQAQMPAPR